MAKKGSKKEEAKEEVKETGPVAVPDKVTLPKGVDQEMYDSVKNIIISGFAADQTPDAIKSAIFATNVPFSKLTKLYSMITKAENLVQDPKKVANEIKTALENIDFTFEETFSALEELAKGIAEGIKGATTAKVIYFMKPIFKENEADFPRKPAAARGRMGSINKTLISVFKENPKASYDDLFLALSKVTKALTNAEYYAKQHYAVLYAVANGMSANEVLTHLSASKE